MIDWTKPLETVTGVPVRLKWPDSLNGSTVEVIIQGDNSGRSYTHEGRHYSSQFPDIRNVAPETPQDRAGAQSETEVTPDTLKRLIALCEAFSATDIDCGDYVALKNEARAIMKDLAPVDEATKYVDDIFGRITSGGLLSDAACKRLMREAFEAGRQLQREGR